MREEVRLGESSHFLAESFADFARKLSRIGLRKSLNESKAVTRAIVSIFRVLWLPMLVGTIIRLVLMPITLDGDLAGYVQTSASTVYGQPIYAYSFEYPPLWGMYLDVVGHFVSAFVPPTAWVTTNPNLQSFYLSSSQLVGPYIVNLSFVMVEKCTLLLFDVASGVLIYALAVRMTGKVRTGIVAFSLWFLNPLVILASAAHGAFDVIPTFCVLAAVVLCLNRSYLLCGVAVSMGTFLKLFPVLFVPLLLALIWSDLRAQIKEVPRSVAMFFAGFALVAAPVLLGPGLLPGFLMSVTSGVTSGAEAYGGAGFWGLLSLPSFLPLDTFLSTDSIRGVVLLVCLVGAIIVLLSYFVALGKIHTPAGARQWLFAAFATASCAYLVTPVVHPQYAVWTLPFILLLSLESRVFKGVYIIITATTAATYLLLIDGPQFLFLPLWYYFHAFTAQEYGSSLSYWIVAEQAFRPWFLVPESIALIAAMALAVAKVTALKHTSICQSTAEASR
jgi:hypothetical protein